MKTIFSSVIQARRLLLFVLLFVVSLLGGFVAIACDSADYTVVKSAKSPDGNLSALLVQRRAHGPLSSDVYYVIMTDNQHEIPNLLYGDKGWSRRYIGRQESSGTHSFAKKTRMSGAPRACVFRTTRATPTRSAYPAVAAEFA